MKKLNRILFSLIAPQIDKNAKCKMQNAELDTETLSAVYALAKRHDLGHLLAGAVKNAECKVQNAEGGAQLIAELDKAQMTAVWRVRNIENEQGRVRKCLEEAGIPFIMLKGAVVRSYYPEAWMRTSSDIDVLISAEDKDRAVELFTSALDYRISTVEQYDASLYSKSGVHLDMHTLFEGDGEDSRLLREAWQDSTDNGGCERFFSPEHFYFYHVAHMAEHVRNGGCGIRPFIDLYLMRSRLEYSRERLDAMLTEYGLARFESAASALSDSWMDGVDAPECDALENYVLTGGVYGSIEQGVAAKRRGGQSGLSYLMHRIFMPYSELKKRHKALDGRPWLTPIFEVWRWCSLIVPARFKRSRAEFKSVARVDGKRVETVKELFDSLGL